MFAAKYVKRIRLMCMAVLLCAGIWGHKAQVDAAQPAAYDYVVTDAEDKVDPTDLKSDTKGIQKILDKAIGSSEMVTIYFPAGDYYVDKPLWVYSNTHIILDDKATVHRMDSMINKGLLHNVDQNGKMDVIGGYNMSENIILEGGTWDGGNIKLATDASDVIRFDHARNITIKDCTIKNVYDCHIIELVGVQNGLISNCTLSGFRYKKGHEKDYTYAREAIQLESAWTNDESAKGRENAAWAKGSVIDGTSCRQVTVTNNTFIDLPCGVGQHHYTSSGKYRNVDITISNNVFKCSSKMKYCKTAITCCGTNNLNVINNTVKGPYRFSIHVIASNGVVICKNQIADVTMNGIMVDKGEITAIQENTLKNIGKHGISVGGGTVKDISKNTITKVKQNGICVDDGKITSITGNTIKDVKKHGISIAGATNKKTSGGTVKNITKNTINKAKQNGICVDAGKVTNMNENIIKNVSKHGISAVGGTIGTGKSRSKGIQNNTISNCKQNGISVSQKAKVSSIGGNKITNVKNNGISLTGKAKVYWVVNNKIKKCKKHGIWSEVKTAKIKGNKGKTK